MTNFGSFDLLEAVELWAEDNGCICSESELADLFREQVLPSVIAEYGADDIIAVNTAFNDWSDSMCKDGLIHEEQYNQYCFDYEG